jgi:hypothetical protein
MTDCRAVRHFVKLDGRTFILHVDRHTGEALRITERKTKAPPMLGSYDVNYWSAAHHNKNPSASTIVARIIKKARQA